MRSRNDIGRFSGIAFSPLIKNPLTHSFFVADNDQGIIAPGAQEFIATEDLLILTTENNIGLTTE